MSVYKFNIDGINVNFDSDIVDDYFENTLGIFRPFNEYMHPRRTVEVIIDMDYHEHIILTDGFTNTYQRNVFREFCENAFGHGGLRQRINNILAEHKKVMPDGVDWATVWSVLWVNNPCDTGVEMEVARDFYAWLFTGSIN